MLDQFFKMSVPKKVTILVVLMLLTGFLFWFLHYSPLQEELAGQQRKAGDLSKQLAEVEIRKKTYDEDLQRREDLKIASVKQQQMLPAETEMPSFLNNLNTVADISGLKIQSIKPLDASPERYYARIPVELRLRGSFLQFTKFFYQVGQLDRIINIENIRFSRPSLKEGNVEMDVTVLATTFRALDSKGKTAPRKKKR
jgi:type IV pilus assembly protein PilO